MTSALAALAESADIELRVTPTDRALFSIADKVVSGGRLSAEDALTLFRSDDLLGIGALADLANRRLNGDRVFICANQHLNPTNVCILRATCTFCSFARTPREDGAYTMSLEEAFHEASQASDTPVREFHIVGGLHPDLGFEYYEDVLRVLKREFPHIHLKAFTAIPEADLRFVVNGRGGPNQGVAGVILKPWNERQRSAQEIKPELQQKVGGVWQNVPGAGTGSDCPFTCEMSTSGSYNARACAYASSMRLPFDLFQSNMRPSDALPLWGIAMASKPCARTSSMLAGYTSSR